MMERPNFVAEYLQLAMNGAEFDDPGLARLRELMAPEEVQRAKEMLITAYLRTLPPSPTTPGAPTPPDSPVVDFADLYLEIVRRGARPDDVRLHMLMSAMSDDECERAKAAIAELWLRAEPSPARPN